MFSGITSRYLIPTLVLILAAVSLWLLYSLKQIETLELEVSKAKAEIALYEKEKIVSKKVLENKILRETSVDSVKEKINESSKNKQDAPPSPTLKSYIDGMRRDYENRSH